MSPFARDLLEILVRHRPHPDNAFLVPLRVRRVRRVVVAGWLLTLVLAGAAFIAIGRLTFALLWLVPLLMIGNRLAWLASFGTHDLSRIPDARADERERAVRDRAHRTAYRLFLIPLALVTAAPAAIALEGLRLGDTFTLTPQMAPYVFVWFSSVYLLYFILPTAVVAWTEPDPPLESEPPFA